ncbi:MAG: hypothetical protein ACLUKN_17285 [Bacilli bacterium]
MQSRQRQKRESALVGGCVRDWLLGLSPKDLDVEIYGLSPKK